MEPHGKQRTGARLTNLPDCTKPHTETSSSSSLQTSSSLQLACPWEVTRQQVLWDGIFVHLHGKSGTCAAVIPAWQLPPRAGTKIHQLLLPAQPCCLSSDIPNPDASPVTLQPCCLSSDIPNPAACLVTLPAWEWAHQGHMWLIRYGSH